MRIGIISEGHSDRAIISSVLIKALNIEVSQIKALRPTYKYDATDIGAGQKTESNWTHVRRECQERELIGAFLSIEGQDYIVIHIDSAEAELYDVSRPNKNLPSYCMDLRTAVINKINEWLDGEYIESILYAVAIEEVEAWILSLYTDAKDTTKSVKAKERLHFELGKRKIDSTVNETNFFKLSKPFIKSKERELKQILDSNCSLREFYHQVKQQVQV